MRTNSTLSPVVTPVVVVLLAFGLGACSGGAGAETPGVTLEEAKARVLEVETEIASYVPEENVKFQNQNQMSKVLIPCLGTDDLSYWPGTTNIALQGEFDEEAIIAKIAAHFSADPEWTIERMPDQEGTPSLVLLSDHGYRFTADYFGGPSFTIKSESACFPTTDLAGMTEY